jgi:hypothetical protein
MKTYKLCLALAVSGFASNTALAQAGETHPMGARANGSTRVVNAATSDTGTLMRKELMWSSTIPVNKRYGQLTPEQKADLHAMYESIAPGDEPPFPVDGMKSIFNALKKGQAKLVAEGDLNLAVTIDADGKPTEVKDYGSHGNPEMTKFAAMVLLMTKFKPAVCSGQPCAMEFPFKLNVKAR